MRRRAGTTLLTVLATEEYKRHEQVIGGGDAYSNEARHHSTVKSNIGLSMRRCRHHCRSNTVPCKKIHKQTEESLTTILLSMGRPNSHSRPNKLYGSANLLAELGKKDEEEPECQSSRSSLAHLPFVY